MKKPKTVTQMGVGKIIALVTAIATLGKALIDWWRTPKPTLPKVQDEKPDFESDSGSVPERNG